MERRAGSFGAGHRQAREELGSAPRDVVVSGDPRVAQSTSFHHTGTRHHAPPWATPAAPRAFLSPPLDHGPPPVVQKVSRVCLVTAAPSRTW